MKKVIVIFYTVLISLCCLSCSSLNMGNVPFSTTVQLQTYSNREDLILQYPSGELAVKLPIDMALQGFPAVENELKVTDEVSAFYGWSSKGVQWVIICGRSSANWTPYNVFLSSDKGRTWTPVVISSNVCEKGLPSFAITGVGFISSEHGFICFRQTICQGPEIYETKDGGVSWKRLEVSVPEEYGTPITVTAMSPIIRYKSTRHFPACSHNFPKAGDARFQGRSRLFCLLGKFPYLDESRRILMAVSSKTSSKTRFYYTATRRISSAAVQPSIWA